VAGFIGSPAMNFLDGKIVRDDGLRFTADGVTLTLPVGWQPQDGWLDRNLTLGVRPEHLTVGDIDGSFTATLQVIEPLGNETLLYFTLGGAAFTVRSQGNVQAVVGDDISLTLPAEHLHIFDPESGAAL
jgi:multiple sugar transport system ATP-binding protein